MKSESRRDDIKNNVTPHPEPAEGQGLATTNTSLYNNGIPSGLFKIYEGGLDDQVVCLCICNSLLVVLHFCNQLINIMA